MYKLMRPSVLHQCPAPQAKLSSRTHGEVEGNHPSFQMPTDLPMSTSMPNYHGWLRCTSMCRIFSQSDIVRHSGFISASQCLADVHIHTELPQFSLNVLNTQSTILHSSFLMPFGCRLPKEHIHAE